MLVSGNCHEWSGGVAAAPPVKRERQAVGAESEEFVGAGREDVLSAVRRSLVASTMLCGVDPRCESQKANCDNPDGHGFRDVSVRHQNPELERVEMPILRIDLIATP